MAYQQPIVFRQPKRTSGFTLVELLMVIAVLSILAVILVPVLLSARERARRTVCAGNLGQLYKAMAMYAGDNDGFRPMYADGADGLRVNGQEVIVPDQSAELVQSLQPYAHSTEIWFCPDDPLRGERYGTTGVLKRHPATSYASGNPFRLHPSGPPTPMQLMPPRLSASEVFLFEDDIMPYLSETPDNTYLYTHNGRFNIVFCDGHVRTMGPHDDDCQGYCH